MASAGPEGKNEEDRKSAMVGPFQVLKDATSSKASFTLFVLNPKNSYFVGLAAVALVSTFYLVFHAGLREIGNGPGTRSEFCFFVLIGLWGGAVATLFQVTIQESIDRFRALNGRLEKEIEALSQEVDTLEGTSDELQKQLGEFNDIRQEMQEIAKKQGVDFNKFFQDTNSIFDNMQDVQKQQDLTLLEKAAADIEFLDNQKGISMHEFTRFCNTVPEKFRGALQRDRTETFKRVAGDDDVISVDELRAFLHAFLSKCNPQAGEP